MEEKTLLKIALVCSLVGIGILFIFSQEIEINESVVSNINSEELDYEETVLLKGVVKRVINNNNQSGSKIIKLEKTEIIDIVVIEQDYLKLETGEIIEVKGKWNENSNKKYGDSLSVLSSEIRRS